MLTDTLQKSFSGLFTESTSNTDAVIRGKEVVKNSTSGSGVTIPASLLTKVQALPEVGAAVGEVLPQEANVADVYGRDGKKAARESVGTSIDAANAKPQPAAAEDRRLAERPGRGRHRRRQRRRRSTTRSATRSSSGRSARSTRTAWPAPCRSARSTRSASRASRPGTSRPPRRCSVARAATTPCRSWPRRAARRPPSCAPSSRSSARTCRSRTAKAQADEDADNLNEGLRTIKLFLLAFGFIALLVGAFVIFNTLSITVAQRTREYATLRTLGASRKQVMRSVRLEGLVIGFVASVIGLVFGIAIAKGLIALFGAMGVELPKATTVIADAHDHRLAAARHRDHAARQHHPRAPGDPRAADRGRP